VKDLNCFNITPFGSMSNVIEHIKDDYAGTGAYHVITANPEIVYEAVCNEQFGVIFRSANLVVADGIGVSLPLAWKGHVSKRIPGIELFELLMSEKELSKNGVYLLGATLETVTKAAKKLSERNVKVCGYRDGFFSIDSNNIDTIFSDIERVKPSIVAVAIGAPRQDIVIDALKSRGLNAIVIGVGGAFDVLSGNVKRAPTIVQKIKLEWLYRLLCDLRRLPRYVKIFHYFVWLFKGKL
jgi:N-acetylglucosaminyldiphosphoundecaprenol N-acetyl-beta-D-mannosaminyltransferase